MLPILCPKKKGVPDLPAQLDPNNFKLSEYSDLVFTFWTTQNFTNPGPGTIKAVQVLCWQLKMSPTNCLCLPVKPKKQAVGKKPYKNLCN